MKFIDGSEVAVFPPSEEKPHQPGREEIWQESYVLYWYDMAQNVGGGVRLGHEPNFDGGRTNTVIVVVSPEGVFRHCQSLPVRPEDVFDSGMTNGDDSVRYEFDGDQIRWTIRADEVEAEVTADRTVPPIDVHRKAGLSTAEVILSGHVDAACRVTGTMVLNGTTYELDAHGLRDHAWGTRDLSVLRSYRWCNASLGDAGSFVAMTFLSADDRMARLGWVIRGDEVLLAEDVTTRTIVTDDGATHVGGTLRMPLETGEVFEARFEPLHPTVAIDYVQVHPVIYHDAYCRVTCGDEVGFGIFETTNNIRGGTLIPRLLDGAVSTNGWHPDARLLRG